MRYDVPPFKQLTRTIDPKTRIHYLDALDENGNWWRAEQSPHIEEWLVFTKTWQQMNY